MKSDDLKKQMVEDEKILQQLEAKKKHIVYGYIDNRTKQKLRYLKLTQGKTVANILHDAMLDVEIK